MQMMAQLFEGVAHPCGSDKAGLVLHASTVVLRCAGAARNAVPTCAAADVCHMGAA